MKRFINILSGVPVTVFTEITRTTKFIEYQRDYPIPSERTRRGESTDDDGTLIFTKPRYVFEQCYKECPYL